MSDFTGIMKVNFSSSFQEREIILIHSKSFQTFFLKSLLDITYEMGKQLSLRLATEG